MADDKKASELDDGGAARATDQVAAVRDGADVLVSLASAAAVLVDKAHTAVNGEDILADTSGGSFTIDVPDDGEAGMKFRITDATDSFGTNALTVGKNSQTIMGKSEDMTVSTDGASFELVHNGTTWKLR